jgi:hypothetical protein
VPAGNVWSSQRPAPTAREILVAACFESMEWEARITTDPDVLTGKRRERDSNCEGQLVAVRGLVQLIKSAPDDRDFHIQLTPDKAGRRGTVIVEIPKPDVRHVRNAALRRLLTREHDSTQY